MSVEFEKELAMRSTIFVSLVLASGVVSFGASACDTREAYNQKISSLLEKYQSEMVKANDAFAREIIPVKRKRRITTLAHGGKRSVA
jgi:hypothetical protein